MLYAIAMGQIVINFAINAIKKLIAALSNLNKHQDYKRSLEHCGNDGPS